jgi:hypothetical protein
MRGSGVVPNVYRLEEEYHRGVKVSKREMELYEKRRVRTPTVDRWSLKIEPIKNTCSFPAKKPYMCLLSTIVFPCLCCCQ